MLNTAAEISNHELVTLCRRGDASAYTALYNKFSKEVYNTIVRIVQHTGEAEDLLQEVFVAVFQSMDNFQEHSNFGAWIKRIAINRSISLLRKRKVSFQEMDMLNPADLKDEDSIDENDFAFKVQEVMRAINELPDGYRTVVQLYLVENIPQEEIGRILGISHNTVRTQYHRAKQKILFSLKEGGLT